jgi:hypothetical protein
MLLLAIHLWLSFPLSAPCVSRAVAPYATAEKGLFVLSASGFLPLCGSLPQVEKITLYG